MEFLNSLDKFGQYLPTLTTFILAFSSKTTITGIDRIWILWYGLYWICGNLVRYGLYWILLVSMGQKVLDKTSIRIGFTIGSFVLITIGRTIVILRKLYVQIYQDFKGIWKWDLRLIQLGSVFQIIKLIVYISHGSDKISTSIVNWISRIDIVLFFIGVFIYSIITRTKSQMNWFDRFIVISSSSDGFSLAVFKEFYSTGFVRKIRQRIPLLREKISGKSKVKRSKRDSESLKPIKTIDHKVDIESIQQVSLKDLTQNSIITSKDEGNWDCCLKCHTYINGVLQYFVLKQVKSNDKNRRDIERQIDIHSIIEHPGIVELYKTFVQEFSSSAKFQLLFEYVEGKSLDKILQRGPLDDDSIRLYTAHLVSALKYLHQNGIVHGNIYSENIVITKDGPKLTNFRCSQFRNADGRIKVDLEALEAGEFKNQLSMYLTINGIPSAWLSYTQNIDWWSLGLVVYKMKTGKCLLKNVFDNDFDITSQRVISILCSFRPQDKKPLLDRLEKEEKDDIMRFICLLLSRNSIMLDFESTKIKDKLESMKISPILEIIESTEREMVRLPINYSPSSVSENSDHVKKVWDLAVDRRLNQGLFGCVYLCHIRKQPQQYYALKRVPWDVYKNQFNLNEAKRKIISEADLLERMNSPFVVKIYKQLQTFENFWMLLEYVDGCDLQRILEKTKKIDINKAKPYINEMVQGIIDIHNAGIIHRDIKIENIMVTQSNHIKILDFGVSKTLGRSERAHSGLGTPVYAAPEVWESDRNNPNNNGYDMAVDWWSFGVVIYEMLTGELPFKCRLIPQPDFEKEPPHLSEVDRLTDGLVSGLLCKDPRKRLGYDEIALKQHPFFKGVNWNDVRKMKVHMPDLLSEHMI